ncbi:MAG: CRISPR-associated endonuclease Cas1 [Leptospiraceae bacterium]|nr:CRISPR-associated endonuclease Cas1 [Leptospiraceae bacterium]
MFPEELTWKKISLKIQNTRVKREVKAHPVSIFESMMKSIHTGSNLWSHFPYSFHCKSIGFHSRIKESDSYEIEVVFPDLQEAILEKWKRHAENFFSNPSERNFQLLDISSIETCNVNKLKAHYPYRGQDEICLNFPIPFAFRYQKDRPKGYLSREIFLESIQIRFERFFQINKENFNWKLPFDVLSYYWNFGDIKHDSLSQAGTVKFIKGCHGPLYLRGNLEEIYPYILICSDIHLGSKLSNSQGYFHFHPDSLGFFSVFFPDKKRILESVNYVMQNYDSAAETLYHGDHSPHPDEHLSEIIEKEIKEESYLPAPSKAFRILKSDQSSRIVEQFHYKDLIVLQYLLRTVTKTFDKIMDTSSIGFRKGYSVKNAIEMIGSAVKEGFHYVIETDIEDFFPSIHLNTLKDLLSNYVPKKDKKLLHLLIKFLDNPYILDGKECNRDKGISQGSPISPILANIYLDSFDESMHREGVRLIRYADDMVILTKTKEMAENILEFAKSKLDHLFLHLKEKKTSIKKISDGFLFLGMKFPLEETNLWKTEEYRKPLFISEPFLFLGTNGDAVTIKKKDKVINTIPIRRISEILFLENSVFSTSFIRKCSENHVPITLTLGSGYHINTICPDSKKYFDIESNHSILFRSLSDTDRLLFAREIAICKVKNYITFFKSRYFKENNTLINQLESGLKNMEEATSPQQLRGFEGSLSRKTFQQLNRYIENEKFHIKKREREKPDSINSLLNFGYYLLYSRINASIRSVGLNPYLGFLHSPEDRYESLVADMEELFRVFVDRFIIKILNLKVITEKDFQETNKGFYLNQVGKKKFLNHWEGEMSKKMGNTHLSIKENIHIQANILKNWVMEGKKLDFYVWVLS